METASVIVRTKKDSSSTSTEIVKVNELPKSFFDYFEWTKQALCLKVPRQMADEMFYAASSADQGKVICKCCPVKDECLIWALMYKEEGVWGGTTDQERKRLLPRYNIKELTSRAVHFGVYSPKRTVQEIRDALFQEAG